MPVLPVANQIRHEDEPGGLRMSTFADSATVPTTRALGCTLVDSNCEPRGSAVVGVAAMPIAGHVMLTYTSATLAVDGSGPAVNVDRQVAAGKYEIVHGLCFVLDQSVVTAFAPEVFLNGGGALANGVVIQFVAADGITIDEAFGTIVRNRDFDQLSKLHGNGEPPSENVSASATDNALICPIVLSRPRRLTAGERLRVVIQDDLSAVGLPNIQDFRLYASIEQGDA
jgi:hypothetical protein